MGAYNLLEAELRCPRCGTYRPADIEFVFGPLEYRTYRLGEVVNWSSRGPRHPSQPPPGGHYSGEGYAECRTCQKDYWVEITVADSVLTEVVVDPSRPGHIPDDPPPPAPSDTP